MQCWIAGAHSCENPPSSQAQLVHLWVWNLQPPGAPESELGGDGGQWALVLLLWEVLPGQSGPANWLWSLEF